MTNFKVGDEVIILRESYGWDTVMAGDLGIVQEVSVYSGFLRLWVPGRSRYDKGCRTWACDSSCVVLVNKLEDNQVLKQLVNILDVKKGATWLVVGDNLKLTSLDKVSKKLAHKSFIVPKRFFSQHRDWFEVVK